MARAISSTKSRAIYAREYYKCNKERIRKEQNEYAKGNYTKDARHLKYERDKAKQLITNKLNHIKVRKEVIDHYGGQCACCGETEFNFLTIDHIGNWGGEHRKQGYSGRNLYYWIRRNKYPDTLRVLCYNCNCSSGFYGSCPHKQKAYSPAPFVWSEPITFHIGDSRKGNLQ